MRAAIAAALAASLAASAALALPGFPVALLSSSAACANCMATPVLARAANSGAPSTSAVQYAPAFGGYSSVTWNATIANRQSIVPIYGKISNLSVNFGTAVTANSWDIGVNVNGAMTNVKCTVTASTCSLADGGTLATEALVSPGDKVTIEACPSGTAGCTAGSAPTGGGYVQVGFTFTARRGQESLVCAESVTTLTGGSTQQFASVLGMSGLATTEINASSVMPAAGYFDDLEVYTGTSPGASASYTVSAYQNGASTSLSCSLTSALSCADVTAGHALHVAAFDTVSISFNPVSSPAGGIAQACMRWRPDTTNQAIAGANSTTVPGTTAVTRYGAAAGDYANTSTEANAYNIAPQIPGGKTLTFGNLAAAYSAAPTSGSRTATLRVAAASPGSGPSAVVTSSTTATVGGVASTPAVQDTTHTATATSGQALDMQSVTATTVNAVTWAKYAFTMTLQ